MFVALVDTPMFESGHPGRGESPPVLLPDIQRVVRQALRVWADIPSADIRWELGPVISEAEAGQDPRYAFPLAIGWRPGIAIAESRFWNRRKYQCTVFMGYPATHDSLEAYGRTLIHELGHCLGLDHPDPFLSSPNNRATWATDGYEIPRYWRYDPVMSYGERAYEADVLTQDDIIGASLLRPREGWLDTTGSIVGRVVLPGGEGVPHAYVLATRLEPEEEAFSVGVFATRQGDPVNAPDDEPGDFEIRGLPPGDYQLLVRAPTGSALNFPYLGPDSVAAALRQTLRTGAVRVRAGEETGPVPLAVRQRGDPFR